MIVEVDYQQDTYLLADGTWITGEELYTMRNETASPTFEDELFEGIKQAVGQEISDFLRSSSRYKNVRTNFENVGPMGGKSVNISAWVQHEEGFIPVVMNLYCDHIVYERQREELLKRQEFYKAQEDIRNILTGDEHDD